MKKLYCKAHKKQRRRREETKIQKEKHLIGRFGIILRKYFWLLKLLKSKEVIKEHKRRWTKKSWVFQSFCVCGSLDAMWCLLLVYRGSDRGGAGRGRQGRDGRASRKGKAEHRILENFYYIFFFVLCFFF